MSYVQTTITRKKCSSVPANAISSILRLLNLLFRDLFLVSGLLHSVNGDELLRMRMFIAENGIQLCKKQSEKVIIKNGMSAKENLHFCNMVFMAPIRGA